MCGIAGLIDLQQNHGPDALRAIAVDMTDRVAHRGPDGSGVFVDYPLALGHRRLAIIDLSEQAAQPMAYDDGRFVITYNGEIYNYIELRETLTQLGHRFSTRSDTEVILAAYKEWGKDCAGRFNGMWAFAIWDTKERILFLSRDRFGVKPLYYIHNENYFAFASEIKQLLPLLGKVTPDYDLAFDFLAFNMLDHTTRTFFVGVEKFPQSHVGQFNLDSRQFTVRPFYTLAPRSDYAALSEGEAAKRFVELLEGSLAFRLRSDVPVGISLSGGLDSSWIAALAYGLNGKAGGDVLTGFTAINDMKLYDETPYVETFLRRYPLQWTRIAPKDDDFMGLSRDVIAAQEEPMATTGPIAQYQVMQAVGAANIKVLLSGQGADETFLGYHKYIPFYLLSLLGQGQVGKMLGEVRSGLANTANLSPVLLAKYMLAARFSGMRSSVQRLGIPFLRSGFSRTAPAALSALSSAQREGITAMQHYEIFTSPLPLLLRYEDRNSMRFGVESRLPFLDYRLVEFAISLPWRLKIKDGWTKWLMRDAARGTLPESIAWRKYKVAYHTPEDRWLSLHDETIQAQVKNNHLIQHISNVSLLKRSWPYLGTRMRWRLYALASWSEIFDIRL